MTIDIIIIIFSLTYIIMISHYNHYRLYSILP